MINISRLLPQYNFIILGNGPLYGFIKEFIKKEEITNIYIPGQTNNVFKYLYASNIYLSTSYYEGLSISILEAMSIGLPVVASKVVGNVDTVDHGKSGYLYELGNIKLAAVYIENILKFNKLYNYLSKGSQNRQRKYFSSKHMINKYLEIYKNY